jgi:hypothetical protein
MTRISNSAIMNNVIRVRKPPWKGLGAGMLLSCYFASGIQNQSASSPCHIEVTNTLISSNGVSIEGTDVDRSVSEPTTNNNIAAGGGIAILSNAPLKHVIIRSSSFETNRLSTLPTVPSVANAHCSSVYGSGLFVHHDAVKDSSLLSYGWGAQIDIQSSSFQSV